MLNDQQETLIEKHFRHELSEAEKMEFEKLLSSDPEFKEAVENQQILLEGLEIIELEKELKNYIAEADQTKVIPLWKNTRWLSIAASLLFFMAATTYAGYKLGWFEGWFEEQEFKEEIPEKAPVEDSIQNDVKSGIRSIYDGVQTVAINPLYSNEIEGGLGTAFLFPSGSLLDDNEGVIGKEVKVELIEQLNPSALSEMIDGSVIASDDVMRIFYVLPYYAEGSIVMNVLTPPKLIIREEEDVELYYGGENRSIVAWRKPVNKTTALIEEPTAAMLDYKRFIEGRLFIDSLNQHYFLKDGKFIHKNGKGMTYEESFVRGIERFVNGYGKDPKYQQKVLQAQNEWRVYSEQHSFDINRSKGLTDNTVPLYEPGWYAVVRK